MYAHEMPAYKVHAHEMHTRDAYPEIHAYGQVLK
jgi:hypothetical protein